MAAEPYDTDRRMVFSRRAALLGGGASLLFAGIGARLYNLQVSQYDQYRDFAENNQFNQRILTPLRGRIVDRFGKVLAGNRKNFRILLVPEEATDIDATLDRISHLIDISPERRARIEREARRVQAFTPVAVEDNLSWDDFARVNIDAPELGGVITEAGETRNYEYGPAMAFVVGYVGPVTERDLERAEKESTRVVLRQPGFRVGREGLERTYDKDLRGEAGNMLVKVNAHGRVIDEFPGSGRKPKQGDTLALTIDAELQLAAMQELEGESAAAVVMDIVTGDVLVLASSPSFDPNAFNVGIDPEAWRALQNDPHKPLLNKTLQGAYPPGSTFKMITALAAQEAGVKPSFRVNCRGKLWYGNRYFNCWKRGGHGPLDMRHAIKNSCDVYFYEMAQRIDIDLLSEVAHKFGLGETHDLGIPGQKAGVIPSRAWKREYFASNPARQTWFPGETLSVAIGQGYVNSTPLQLALMTARIASGRAVRPRIVRSVGQDLRTPVEAPEIDIDPTHIQVVRDGMDMVVNQWGTGARSRLKDWRLAGKTGTSQVGSLQRDPKTGRIIKSEDLPWKQRDHALFVCYAPFEAPRYACAVIVEHGNHGSSAAAPRASRLMEKVLTKNPAAMAAWTPPSPPEQTIASGAPGDPTEG